MTKILEKVIDTEGKVVYYIESKSYYAPVKLSYSLITCEECGLNYTDNNFQRVANGLNNGQPCYYRENWEETRLVKDRKIKYFLCSAECAGKDAKRNPINLK